MNREQVEKILPILQAFAEGKPIQYRMWSGKWDDATSINVKFLKENPERFRIKPEPRRFKVYIANERHPLGAGNHVVDPSTFLPVPEFWDLIEVVEDLDASC